MSTSSTTLKVVQVDKTAAEDILHDVMSLHGDSDLAEVGLSELVSQLEQWGYSPSVAFKIVSVGVSEGIVEICSDSRVKCEF